MAWISVDNALPDKPDKLDCDGFAVVLCYLDYTGMSKTASGVLRSVKVFDATQCMFVYDPSDKSFTPLVIFEETWMPAKEWGITHWIYPLESPKK